MQFFQGLRHPWDGHDDHSHGHGHGHGHEVLASDSLSSLSNMLLLILLMNLKKKVVLIEYSEFTLICNVAFDSFYAYCHQVSFHNFFDILYYTS